VNAPAAPAVLPVPSLRRRLAAFVYEGVLLFGVLMLSALAYGLVTQQRHALVGMHGLQAFVFAVLGIYFTWFWTHGGQTVAMKTWHLCLQSRDGQPVPVGRAWLRYLLCWLWFLPALGGAYLAGWHSGGAVTLALLANVVVYASLTWLTPQRQYLHDLLARTRLVQVPPAPRKKR
jgi:uncharacterized RDD family membrane protein YckC